MLALGLYRAFHERDDIYQKVEDMSLDRFNEEMKGIEGL